MTNSEPRQSAKEKNFPLDAPADMVKPCSMAAKDSIKNPAAQAPNTPGDVPPLGLEGVLSSLLPWRSRRRRREGKGEEKGEEEGEGGGVCVRRGSFRAGGDWLGKAEEVTPTPTGVGGQPPPYPDLNVFSQGDES